MATISACEVFVNSPGRNYVTLKVTTSDGIVGWGDATLNGRELAVAAALRDHIAPLLLDRDPSRIEDTWQYLYRGVYWRRGPVNMASIAAVDMALWDIKAKAAGVPLYQVLGGACRDYLPTYTHAFGWEASELIESVQRRVEQGFTAVRCQSGVPGLDRVYGVSSQPSYEPAQRRGLPVEERWDSAAYIRHVPGVLEQVRDTVGPELSLLHDVHHRLSPTEAAQLCKRLEDLNMFWVEDVTPAENQSALRQVRSATTVPLAIGEIFNTVWDATTIIGERLVDYIRASATHAGGISHLRKILAFAEIHGIKGAPHGPSDVSPIGMAANIHLGMATWNLGIQEFMGYSPQTDDAFPHAWSYADGGLHPGDALGLGVSMDESVAPGFDYEPAYLPFARSIDGSMTDW